jgi:Phosphatidylethanolamine-binding protein
MFLARCCSCLEPKQDSKTTAGAPHHYTFTLIATDLEPTALQPGMTRDEVMKALDGHAKGATGIIGTFSKPRTDHLAVISVLRRSFFSNRAFLSKFSLCGRLCWPSRRRRMARHGVRLRRSRRPKPPGCFSPLACGAAKRAHR